MLNTSASALYWIGLSSIPGVGRITFRKLVDHFGSPEQVLSAPCDALKNVDGLSEKVVHAISSFPWQEKAAHELAQAAGAQVAIVTADSSDYPANLRNAPDPPLFLYVKGNFLPSDVNAVAIVGTRKPTHYGTSITDRMASALANAGFTVVSGMARGIDTHAHRGALAAQGRTIAVLGCGIDVAYPPENRKLMETIGQSGAVVTENPFGTRPESGYFPSRNRIISGLSRGTVIIEATEDSGSLITAKFTLEQGRRLYAVPGNVVSAASRGTNSLIKQGAKLVENAADILQDLGAAHPARTRNTAPRAMPILTAEEQQALNCITHEPKHIDVIIKESSMTAGALGGILMTLELKGLAKQLPGKYFVNVDPA